MSQDQLPLFPLGVVLFPGAVLPLHIFEERYKEMIGELLETENEFGVVLASEKGMANIGCTAVIEKILKKYPDGRLDILVRGRRRFEIILLDEGRNFLRAAVAMIADEDSTATDDLVKQRVLSTWVKLMVMEHGGVVQEMPDQNRGDLSFVIGEIAGDLEFKQQLLSMKSERERMEALSEYLPSYLEREKLTRHVRRVAPLNGFAKHGQEVLD
ncbi:LON peptidase substrate-binding domain-containing protein [Bryobacter aggregatus]|uniref:LON peptidase substrate-binding domain-containing protein n=1 Tax=Bryobacter aggregatus TaxID=360054 RepID=UPI00055D1445|nr:LON peptidase substrate-binding domain-containing protein [Bryobacter aggregatus]